jgi:hypothetical protein
MFIPAFRHYKKEYDINVKINTDIFYWILTPHLNTPSPAMRDLPHRGRKHVYLTGFYPTLGGLGGPRPDTKLFFSYF